MKRIIFSAILLASAAFTAVAQAALQPLVVIKLNGHESITVKEVKDQVELYQAQSKQKFGVEEKKIILESLINQKLMVQAAKKAGIAVSDSQVNQAYLTNLSQIAGRQVTEKDFADMVRKNYNGKTVDQFLVELVHMNVAQYKAYLRNQLLAQQYVMQQKGKEIQGVQATDKEIRDFYESNKSKFVRNDGLRMFLVSVPKNGNPAEAEKKIKQLLSDFNAKKLTLEKMREASQNPTAAGYAAGDMIIEKTEDYAKLLGVTFEHITKLFDEPLNKASDIKETSQDYQFYVLLEKYSAKMLGISDVVSPGTTMTIYEWIKQNLTLQKQQNALLKAVEDLSRQLNTEANVERKKTGKDLEAALAW
ncbi:MAG: SurA N-terminal domain-containing protein [Treponema sp.]|nr:SurA N-terminal domain-containing protein [Treponema sp.]